jgi:hypothetical protein
MNANSPENLLTPWILSNYNRYLEYGSGNNTKFGQVLLANLLKFALEKNVGVEMYDWIESSAGQKYLKDKTIKPVGGYMLSGMNQLNDSYIDFMNEDYDEMVLSALSEFINDNYEEIRFPLILK